MMICIFVFVLFFFFSLYICCPLFSFFVFYVFYIDILCAVTASLSAVSRGDCLFDVGIPSFLSRTVFLFYVILWRGDHRFLCIVFPIFLSLFVVSYWNLLFWFSSGALSVLSHQSCKTMADGVDVLGNDELMYRREGNVGFASWLSVPCGL